MNKLRRMLIFGDEKGGGGGGRPQVPQTGTWQFKTTPTKGYIIIGHDDDTNDSARFVRMVNGYGYPVVLNTIASLQDNQVVSDADNNYYPSGTTSQFPDGTTIEELNKYVIANNKGEVAQHGVAKIWDSNRLTDTVMDGYYATYTEGGGTKTKEELKQAIMEKYASSDLSQGASMVESDRASLEETLGTYMLTIGAWGGHTNFVIDDITVGASNSVEAWTNKNGFSRSKNYMGDSQFAVDVFSIDPYYIDRELEKITSSVGSYLQKAYDGKRCIELFYHNYLNSDSNWSKFKAGMDIIKEWVDLGKIEVVTRKGYYDLGEWVENPIIALELTPSALYYEVGATITASDFTCKAILADGTKVNCESDKILDLSNVDTSAEGNFEVTLSYRGFTSTIKLYVVTTVPTLNYLLQNGSYSGDSLTRLANYGTLDPSVSYASGKAYRLEFDFSADTVCSQSTHYIGFQIGEYAGNWASGSETQLTSRTGRTSGHVVYNFTVSANKTASKLFKANSLGNTTVSAWKVFNAMIYEVPT